MYTSMTSNLMVESVDKSIAFYQTVLGFSVIESVQGKGDELQFAILMKDNLMLMVQERTSLIEECPSMQTDRVKPSISLYINVDNVEALHAELQKTCALYIEMHTSFYGAREFAITDVDGYVIVFAQQANA